MTTELFVNLAVKGFGLGFCLGFALWGLVYTFKVFRNAILSGMRLIE